MLLATLGDEDAFQYFDQLKQLYPQAETHVFELDGGHHMLFLHPEEYSRVLSGIFT